MNLDSKAAAHHACHHLRDELIRLLLCRLDIFVVHDVMFAYKPGATCHDTRFVVHTVCASRFVKDCVDWFALGIMLVNVGIMLSAIVAVMWAENARWSKVSPRGQGGAFFRLQFIEGGTRYLNSKERLW